MITAQDWSPMLEKETEEDVSINGEKNVILELIIIQNAQHLLIGTTELFILVQM